MRHLGSATIYSFIIPLSGGITLFDAALLFSLFFMYAFAAVKANRTKSSWLGPGATTTNSRHGRRL